MAERISKEQVKKIAVLSSLNLDDESVEEFAKLFSQTLDYIDLLDELNTGKVQPTYQVTGLTNVFMENGRNQATLEKGEALKNAGEVVRGLFATEAVFER